MKHKLPTCPDCNTKLTKEHQETESFRVEEVKKVDFYVCSQCGYKIKAKDFRQEKQWE